MISGHSSTEKVERVPRTQSFANNSDDHHSHSPLDRSNPRRQPAANNSNRHHSNSSSERSNGRVPDNVPLRSSSAIAPPRASVPVSRPSHAAPPSSIPSRLVMLPTKNKNRPGSKVQRPSSIKKDPYALASRSLVKLNEKKRDLRTIEEIQMDLKKKKVDPVPHRRASSTESMAQPEPSLKEQARMMSRPKLARPAPTPTASPSTKPTVQVSSKPALPVKSQVSSVPKSQVPSNTAPAKPQVAAPARSQAPSIPAPARPRPAVQPPSAKSSTPPTSNASASRAPVAKPLPSASRDYQSRPSPNNSSITLPSSRPMKSKDIFKITHYMCKMYISSWMIHMIGTISPPATNKKRSRFEEEEILPASPQPARKKPLTEKDETTILSNHEYVNGNYRDIIRNMFGVQHRNFRRYDDEDSDDMEASVRDIEREDRRTYVYNLTLIFYFACINIF